MQLPQEKLIHFLRSTGVIDIENAIRIAEHFSEKNLAKNELFLQEGRVSNEYLILEEGLLWSYAIDIEGNEVTTAFYTAVQPVFEVASFFNRTPSKENIQALAPSKGWVITFEKLNVLFHTIPAFREFGRSILVKGFASLKLRMLSMITETADARYAAFVSTHPEVLQKVPLKYIASYLGITDTSLSRIRKEMMKREQFH